MQGVETKTSMDGLAYLEPFLSSAVTPRSPLPKKSMRASPSWRLTSFFFSQPSACRCWSIRSRAWWALLRASPLTAAVARPTQRVFVCGASFSGRRHVSSRASSTFRSASSPTTSDSSRSSGPTCWPRAVEALEASEGSGVLLVEHPDIRNMITARPAATVSSRGTVLGFRPECPGWWFTGSLAFRRCRLSASGWKAYFQSS